MAPNEVVFGNQRLDVTEASEQRRTFTQIVTHPSYNPTSSNSEYDLVLLLLNQPVDFTNPNGFVRPMCLAYNTNEGDTYENCLAAGWGDLMQGSMMGKSCYVCLLCFTLRNQRTK